MVNMTWQRHFGLFEQVCNFVVGNYFIVSAKEKIKKKKK